MEATEEDEISLLNKFSDWVKDEKITEDVDPDLILNFLRSCKFRMSKAQAKYRNYFQLREKTPEWFVNRDPNLKELKKLLAIGVTIPLPEKDEENRYTVLTRAAMHDPKTTPLIDVYRIGLMVWDLLLATNPDISKNGIHVIIDLNGVSFGHVFQMTPFLVKKTVWMWENCYPLRFSTFNFVNCPYFVGFLINLMKNFMTQKLRNRVKVHGSYDELSKVVNPKCLPNEYGGTAGEIKIIKDSWSEKIIQNREWYLNNMKKCYLVNEC